MDKAIADWLQGHPHAVPDTVRADTPPMIGVIATLKAKAGHADRLRDALQAAASLVRPNEPDVVAYHVNRSRDDPNIFKMFEIYRDEKALENHRTGTAYIERLRQHLYDHLEMPPEVEYLDSIFE